MNRVFSRLGLTAAAIVAGGGIVAHAQTATTGAVSGVISDKNGTPMAGVTVRLSSTQTSRTYLTGTDGSFRMGLLNPGAWTIELTKGGFQKVSQNITVLVNQTQPMNFKMATEAATVVEVLGTATSIDTTTAQTGLTTTMDSLSAIPKGRDMSSVAFLAPGVVTGGFGNDPSIGGGSSAENAYIVDGLSTTNTARGFQGASLVTDFIDQVEVQTGGFKPEYSALGGVFNAVTKTGGNQMKGSAWLTWDAIGIQAVPKKSDYAKQASPYSRYDIGAEVSGPLIKDKLFYFVGFDGNITESPSALPNASGFTDGKEKLTTYQLIAKVNWLISLDHQLTFSANVNDAKDDWPNRYPSTTPGSAQLGYNDKNTTQNFVVNYDWTISPSLFFSAKLGSSEYKDEFSPSDITNIAVSDTAWFTIGPGTVPSSDPLWGQTYRRGGIGYYAGLDKTKNTQFRADLSWFLGDHNMKFGISQLDSKYTEKARTSGGERVTVRRFNSGAFRGIDRQFLSTDATVQAVFTGLYAQDSWDLGAGFKLMYGARYEIQDQKDYRGRSFMKFDKFQDQLQPRLGFTWDLNGDGKSKVSFNYARYFEQIPQRLAIRVYANEQYLRFRYSASNSSYNTATGAYAYDTLGLGPDGGITDFATPFSFDPIGEGAKLPRRDEWVLGYDHTFASGWTAGIHTRYRELKNPLEDMVFTDEFGNPYDEGPAIAFDGLGNPIVGAGAAVIGNPGAFQQWRPNAASMSLYWLALGNANPNGAGPGYSYNSYGINILDYYNPATGLFTVPNTGYTKAGNKYTSVDFTLEKKTERDTFNFSYTWSRLEGNYEGIVSSSNGQADGNITASFDYYPYVGYGLLPNDRTHQVKVYASHRFDLAGGDLNAGFAWTYYSGTPVSLFDDGSTSEGNPPGTGSSLDIGGYGNAVPANGQLGQYGRTPAQNNVDAHLDWTGKFGKFRVIPSVDVFNLFNSRTATRVYEQATDQSGISDPRWGQDRAWQVGRRFRFGVKFQF